MLPRSFSWQLRLARCTFNSPPGANDGCTGSWLVKNCLYSWTCPLRPPYKSDHLKIADTPFQCLQFADSNVRSAFLKMRPPEKCELRTPEVGPKCRFNLRKATTYIKLSEKHIFDRPTFPLQEWAAAAFASSAWQWSLPITPPRTHGDYRSLMSTAHRRGKGYVYDSILKKFEPTWHMGPPEKQDHFFPVPSVVVIHRFDCTVSGVEERGGRCSWIWPRIS